MIGAERLPMIWLKLWFSSISRNTWSYCGNDAPLDNADASPERPRNKAATRTHTVHVLDMDSPLSNWVDSPILTATGGRMGNKRVNQPLRFRRTRGLHPTIPETPGPDG